MVLELSLNKPKPKGDQLILCTHSQTYYKPPPRSMEERRVLLGCFLVTSMYDLHPYFSSPDLVLTYPSVSHHSCKE